MPPSFVGSILPWLKIKTDATAAHQQWSYNSTDLDNHTDNIKILSLIEAEWHISAYQ